MGGQACILCGAAEFSRNVDLAVLANKKNLERLRLALDKVEVQPVYFPALSSEALNRGHACHFRSLQEGMGALRIDVMSRLHGCDPFAQLWKRRRRLILPGLGMVSVLSLWDLVQAKKTIRDKDWPMVRRLVEFDYYSRIKKPGKKPIDFWFLECRTPTILQDLAKTYSTKARSLAARRPLLQLLDPAQEKNLISALREEEDQNRARDRQYWQPLREELFAMRQAQR